VYTVCNPWTRHTRSFRARWCAVQKFEKNYIYLAKKSKKIRRRDRYFRRGILIHLVGGSPPHTRPSTNQITASTSYHHHNNNGGGGSYIIWYVRDNADVSRVNRIAERRSWRRWRIILCDVIIMIIVIVIYAKTNLCCLTEFESRKRCTRGPQGRRRRRRGRVIIKFNWRSARALPYNILYNNNWRPRTEMSNNNNVEVYTRKKTYEL